MLMIQLEQERHPLGIGGEGLLPPSVLLRAGIGGINSLVQCLMRFSQVRRHGNGIIEVGE